MKEDSSVLSRPLLYSIFAFSILAFLSAAVLLALLPVYGYMGFDTTSSVTAGTCLDNYFINKYNSHLQTILSAVFVSSVLAVLFSAVILVICLVWVVRVCRGGSPVGSINPALKVALYILASCLVLTAIIAMGYHMTYLIELGNCSGSTASSTDLIVLLALAALLLAFAVLLWILLLCGYCKDKDADEKYREVASHPTEQNQRVQEKKKEPIHDKKVQEVYQKQKTYRQPRHNEKVEQTQDNLYESPKKQTHNIYAKEPQQHPTHQPTSYSKYQSPANPHPEPKSRIPEETNLSFIPSKSAEKDPQEGLVFFRPRRDVVAREDDESLHREEKKYLSKYGASILPSSGLEQKYANTNSRLASEYFRSPSASRRPVGPSPTPKDNREGILLKHIRGKYVN